MVVAIDAEAVSVELVETVSRPKPHESGPVLEDGFDGAVGHPVFYAIVVEPVPPAAGEGISGQAQEQDCAKE